MIKKTLGRMPLWIVDVTAEHLALLSSADIHKTKGKHNDFIGFGGYRPLGNGDFYGDVSDALDYKIEDGAEFPTEFCEKADRLYDELDGVLMVVLKRRSFELGRYFSTDMGTSWFTEKEMNVNIGWPAPEGSNGV